MEFNFDDLNPGTRFFLNEINEKDGYVDLRVCPADILEDIEEKTSTEKVTYKRGQRHVIVKKDRKRWKLLFWDYVICGWGGMTNKGKEIALTPENKVKLMGGSVKFSSFVSAKLELLQEDEAAHEEETEKN